MRITKQGLARYRRGVYTRFQLDLNNKRLSAHVQVHQLNIRTSLLKCAELVEGLSLRIDWSTMGVFLDGLSGNGEEIECIHWVC